MSGALSVHVIVIYGKGTLWRAKKGETHEA
jgi:hypothetical protein